MKRRGDKRKQGSGQPPKEPMWDLALVLVGLNLVAPEIYKKASPGEADETDLICLMVREGVSDISEARRTFERHIRETYPQLISIISFAPDLPPATLPHVLCGFPKDSLPLVSASFGSELVRLVPQSELDRMERLGRDVLNRSARVSAEELVKANILTQALLAAKNVCARHPEIIAERRASPAQAAPPPQDKLVPSVPPTSLRVHPVRAKPTSARYGEYVPWRPPRRIAAEVANPEIATRKRSSSEPSRPDEIADLSSIRAAPHSVVQRQMIERLVKKGDLIIQDRESPKLEARPAQRISEDQSKASIRLKGQDDSGKSR